MTMHTTQTLYDELSQMLVVINAQVDSVVKELERRIGALPDAQRSSVYAQRTTDGKPVLAELLVAKATILSGMARLKAADIESRTPRPRR